MPRVDRLALGSTAEDAACAWALARGWTLLARNVRYRFCELDLVLRDGASVVFVEVRRRRASRFGDGAASVDRGKRRRVILAARAWLAGRPRYAEAPCRFDVASVSGVDGALAIEWIGAAFDADDG